MGQALGQVLPLAVGVAISPVPIIAVILMLGTRRGRVNGPVFLAGWAAGLAVVGAIVLLASNGASSGGGGPPSTWRSILDLVVGVLLVFVALRAWRGRPRGSEEPELPGWLRAVDTFTPRRSAALAVALAAVNPKNLLLTIAAASAIGQADAGTGGQVIALAVFVLVATLGPGLPVVAARALGDRADELLADVKRWMARHNGAIMTVICLVLAAKSIGDAISGFTS